jgi:hypothetical protein
MIVSDLGGGWFVCGGAGFGGFGCWWWVLVVGGWGMLGV